MHRFIRQRAQIAAGISFLSWFALYLEVFRWRHVTPSRLASVVWPPAGIADRPGWFVRTVVVVSAVAPLACMVFAAAGWKHRARSPRDGRDSVEPKFRVDVALAIFGGALSVLGMTDQAVRRPPLVVDLTLQRGNGGFVVLGLTLMAAGFFMHNLRRGAAK